MNMTPWLGLQTVYGRFDTFHECLLRFKNLTPLFNFFIFTRNQASFQQKIRDYCFYVPIDKLFEPCTIERKILKLERFEEKKPIKVTVLGVCFSVFFNLRLKHLKS